MPGVFSKSARPARPGAYFDWASVPVSTILPNIGSVVLVAITHDWGPAGTVVSCGSLGDFQAAFGMTTLIGGAPAPGYAAVKQCFKGEGLAGRGGAGTVLVYRMVGTSGKAATITIQNTTPANALSLTAKYPGAFGNQIGFKSHVNAADATKNDLQIWVAGQMVEVYTYTKATISSLVTQINDPIAGSDWVTATLILDGTALPVTTTPDTVTSLATGDSGSTLVQQDWVNMTNGVTGARFSLFAGYDVTDPTTLTALQGWCSNANVTGHRFMMVCGGAASDTAVTAIARSASIVTASQAAGTSGENTVNLGVGSLYDSDLGATLSTSQLAPRVAGILAARGESMSITFARLADTSAGVLPIDSDVTKCFNGGVVVFGQDSNPDSPIRIEKGLTCYIGGDSTKPYLIYRQPKFMRTMHGIELDITEWAASNAIGSLQVNDATRAFIVGYAHSAIQARADRGVIQTGFSVGIDPIPPPSDDDEFVALLYGIAFGRSVEQIYNLVYIS
jgi:hypothetical protein